MWHRPWSGEQFCSNSCSNFINIRLRIRFTFLASWYKWIFHSLHPFTPPIHSTHPFIFVGVTACFQPWPSQHPLGFFDKNCFTGWGNQLHPQHKKGDQDIVFMSPGDTAVQLYPRILGKRFSGLLRHPLTWLGLFLLTATARGHWVFPHQNSFYIIRLSSF